jgi:hypothetical protein
MVAHLCLAGLLVAGDPPVSELKPPPAIREFSSKGPPPPGPMKVADVIKGLGLDESDMGYSDEPPGKLRQLHWSRVKFPGTDAEVDVAIDIVYTPDLLSVIRLNNGKVMVRGWDIKAVRAATVLKVTIAPSRRHD